MLKTALSQYGIKEIVGSEHNQRIVEYAKACGWTWIKDDETPWCSIFMNWAALTSGYERSGKPDARSWLKIGTEITIPETGDIVVFKRGNSDWQGHVGLFISEEGEYINVLGGNQSDSVRIAKYAKADLLGYRKLKKP